MRNRTRTRGSSGTSTVEYAVAAGLLVVVMAGVGFFLAAALRNQAGTSIRSNRTMAPCGPGSVLSGEQCK